MSRQENPKKDFHDLSELEAALAALVPRAEQLNRDRLMFLAGQASLESKISQPAAPLVTTCPQRAVGWAWPAAFAAMTGIAVLLAALLVRPASQVAQRQLPQVAEQIATLSATPREPVAVAHDSVEPGSLVDSPAIVSALPDWLAWALFPQPAVSMKREPSYPELRNRVLMFGLGSWKPQVSESAATGRNQEAPVSSREQLNRWLEQEGVEGALRRPSAPTPRNRSGARS